MITIITGATLTGKTAFAQKLLEQTRTPYLSIDHLMKGLMRSEETELTPQDVKKMTKYLWQIVSEMIKTAIDGEQDLIVEGLFIPDDWITEFTDTHLQHIKYVCLVMSEEYIEYNFDSIIENASIIEKRDVSHITKERLIEDNMKFLEMCEDNLYPYIYINDEYIVELN